MIQVFNNLFINARESMPDGGQIDLSIEPEFITSLVSSVLKAGQKPRLTLMQKGSLPLTENLKMLIVFTKQILEFGSSSRAI